MANCGGRVVKRIYFKLVPLKLAIARCTPLVPSVPFVAKKEGAS